MKLTTVPYTDSMMCYRIMFSSRLFLSITYCFVKESCLPGVCSSNVISKKAVRKNPILWRIGNVVPAAVEFTAGCCIIMTSNEHHNHNLK